MALTPGASAILQGLSGRADLNEQEGTICGEMANERWPVRLAGEGRPVLVRGCNLTPKTDGLRYLVWFEARRNIAAGEELCFDYGSSYRWDYPGDKRKAPRVAPR